MYIVATDRGDPRLSASVLVTVLVEDVNEFNPEFQFSEEDFPDGVYTIETLSSARTGTSETTNIFPLVKFTMWMGFSLAKHMTYYMYMELVLWQLYCNKVLFPFSGTILLTVLATDEDGRDNTITYDIIYDTDDIITSGSSSGSGSGTGISEPAADNFNFSISSEGAITNNDLFPTVDDDEVWLSCFLSQYFFILFSRMLHIRSRWLPQTTVAWRQGV